MSRIAIVLMCLMLLSCGNKEEDQLPVTEIHHIQELGTLATTEYTFGKIVQLNDDKDWYRFGDRKILLSVKAKVKAGVDLTRMNDRDVEVSDDGKTVKLMLPAPEIVAFDMNPNDIKTEMTDVNGFRFEFTQDEKMKVLQLGEKSIRTEMMESNILSDAKKNARVFLKDFYQDMGYENVIIDFKPSEESGKK